MITWLKRLWRSLWKQPATRAHDPEVARLVIEHQKLNFIASITREFEAKNDASL
jgi:hypothetical protein